MNRLRIAFESHTVHHYDLTTLRQEQLAFELRESKRAIEAMLGSRVTKVAYPSGMYNGRVIAQAREAGYLGGWKKGGGPVTPRDDPYRLPRIRVRGCTTISDFKKKVWSRVEVLRTRGLAELA